MSAPPPGLWALVEWRAAATPDALFAVDEHDRALRFAEFRDAALRCAAGLHARGIGPGSAVSWMLPTWLESLVLTVALARLGARQNPILPIYRERELRFIVAQSEPRMLFVPGVWRGFDYRAMAEEVAKGAPGLEVVVVDGALPEADPARLPPAPADDDAIRWLLYSSGTTADPKGALHSDATLFAAAGGLADVLSLRADDRIALVFPVTHIGGVAWLMAGLIAGAAQIVVPIFDPKQSIPVLARHGVTQGTAGTAFHQAYLAAQRAQPDVPLFPSIRTFPGGGAPKPPSLHYEIKAELGGAGIVSGYGLTECPIISMNRTTDPDEKLAHTEGRANPASMQIRVAENGELLVRGPQLCKGYLDARLNEAAFEADGFFHTGDLGIVDADGFVVITGRLKDVIIRKGENISAREIEDLLYEHPRVRDVAVIGLPDPASGERACAVVECEGEPLSFEEMTAFLRERQLANQKLPEQLEVVDALPRNTTGKVLKQALKERFATR